MSTPTTVGIDDDLAASQTSISLGPSNDEEPGWLNLTRLAWLLPQRGLQLIDLCLHGMLFDHPAGERG